MSLTPINWRWLGLKRIGKMAKFSLAPPTHHQVNCPINVLITCLNILRLHKILCYDIIERLCNKYKSGIGKYFQHVSGVSQSARYKYLFVTLSCSNKEGETVSAGWRWWWWWWWWYGTWLPVTSTHLGHSSSYFYYWDNFVLNYQLLGFISLWWDGTLWEYLPYLSIFFQTI